MELPDAFVVGQALVMPENTDGAVARTLRSALTQPAVGSPRRPDLIRVTDDATAAEVRAEVAGTIPVTVAPTPELDDLLQHLIATMPASQDDEPSYFAGGRVTAPAVEKLFTAGSSLFIPALGVNGACLSIIGQLDESRSVLFFPSLDGFEQFRDAAQTGAVEHGSVALGTELLSLAFKPATELPPSMRREAMEHGWPVESADAYPLVAHREPDGRPRPLVERDVQIATACALSLNAFFAKHAAVWEVEAVDPGKTVTLHDLLSGERRTVQETRGSKTLVARDALLARIVDHDDVSLLCGMHHRALPPLETAEVVRRARARRRRKRAVPVERLRDAGFGRRLIRYWENAVEDLDVRSAMPPDLRNGDGDPLLLTVNHFEVTPEDMAAIDARIAEMEGARQETAGEDASVYVFLRTDDATRPDGEQTVVGRVQMAPRALRIETNSQARADALREWIEAACGSRIRHRAREHMDSLALSKNAEQSPPAPTPASPEQQEFGSGVQGAPLYRLARPAAAGAEPQDAARVRTDRRRPG